LQCRTVSRGLCAIIVRVGVGVGGIDVVVLSAEVNAKRDSHRYDGEYPETRRDELGTVLGWLLNGHDDKRERKGATNALVNRFAHILNHIKYVEDTLTMTRFRFWCLTSFCNQVLLGSAGVDPRPIMLVCERRASSVRVRPVLEEGSG
jgi:hypothetical protein